jgi:methyl-accepting chemotaxis protein
VGKIRVIVTQINDISGAIDAAVAEQTAATDTIGRNVDEAAQGITDISRNIEGVAAAAQATASGATQTPQAASELGRLASELQTMVSRFTLAATADGAGPRVFQPGPNAQAKPARPVATGRRTAA